MSFGSASRTPQQHVPHVLGATDAAGHVPAAPALVDRALVVRDVVAELRKDLPRSVRSACAAQSSARVSMLETVAAQAQASLPRTMRGAARMRAAPACRTRLFFGSTAANREEERAPRDVTYHDVIGKAERAGFEDRCVVAPARSSSNRRAADFVLVLQCFEYGLQITGFSVVCELLPAYEVSVEICHDVAERLSRIADGRMFVIGSVAPCAQRAGHTFGRSPWAFIP